MRPTSSCRNIKLLGALYGYTHKVGNIHTLPSNYVDELHVRNALSMNWQAKTDGSVICKTEVNDVRPVLPILHSSR
jgi:hypothetical protein